jgi:hypothetical protein
VNNMAPIQESKRRKMSARQKMQIVTQLSRSGRDGRSKLVDQLAANLSVPKRNIWRWFRDFEERGSRAFTPVARSDRGRSRFFGNNPRAMAFVLVKFKYGVTNPSALRAAMLREFSGDVPSLSCLRSYLHTLQETAS